MTIKINDDTIALWFMQVAVDGDWLAHLAKTDEPDAFKFTYRFRYYEGDQSLEFENSQDRKNWYEGTLHKPRGEVIDTIRELQKHLITVDGEVTETDCWELIRGDDESPDQFMDRLREKPFAKTQVIDLDEARLRGLVDGT